MKLKKIVALFIISLSFSARAFEKEIVKKFTINSNNEIIIKVPTIKNISSIQVSNDQHSIMLRCTFDEKETITCPLHLKLSKEDSVFLLKN